MTKETSDLLVSRRNLLVGASVAAAGSLVGVGTATAKAPLQGIDPGNFRRVKLGGFEVTTVADGYAAVPKVHPIFGNNQKPEDVAAHLQANFLPSDKMAIPFTPVVVNTGNELVLFDTGNGGGRGPTRGHLVKSLAAAGFKPEQIDVVLVRHDLPAASAENRLFVPAIRASMRAHVLDEPQNRDLDLFEHLQRPTRVEQCDVLGCRDDDRSTHRDPLS